MYQVTERNESSLLIPFLPPAGDVRKVYDGTRMCWILRYRLHIIASSALAPPHHSVTLLKRSSINRTRNTMPISIEVPDNYGYVILSCVVGQMFTAMYMGGPVMEARKKFNVPYPNLYATP